MSTPQVAGNTRSAATIVLITLAAGQFLMTLDTTVMNVSIATVAKDVNTTVTGIQQAITFYTLVMATLMITGAKIGAIIGRKRAFAIGCVIYGCGSFVTSLSWNLTSLMVGWSILEGVGAALIMPAIVALVANNFPREKRPATYGLIAAAGAMAVALGPIIGGIATTYFSWRYVFAGEVLVVIAILIFARKIIDTPVTKQPKIDVVGVVLSALGLGLAVFGVLRSSEWGWIQAKPDAPAIGSVSLTLWLIIAGLFVLWLFFRWEAHVVKRGREPLVRIEMFRNRRLTGGLTMFFFQFLVQAGLFFVVPLYLSVALGLSAIDTGVRLLPLSGGLLITAIGIPKLFPQASPRLVVRLGLLSLLVGTLSLIAGLTPTSTAEVVLIPMFFAGLGIGALASQLGAVTVSSVPDDKSPEVGGLQNTMTNLGASLGTAIAGSILIAAMTTSFLTGIENNPAVPSSITSKANVELAGGVQFISDADLQKALDEADVPADVAEPITTHYQEARIKGLRSALGILGILSVVALFMAGQIPSRQPSASSDPGDGLDGQTEGLAAPT